LAYHRYMNAHIVGAVLTVLVVGVGLYLKFRPGAKNVFQARADARSQAVAEANAAGLTNGALFTGLMTVNTLAPGVNKLAGLSPTTRYQNGSGLLIVRPGEVRFEPTSSARSAGLEGWQAPAADVTRAKIMRMNQTPRLVILTVSGSDKRYFSPDWKGLLEALRAAGSPV